MPINYTEYPPNWLTEIRPSVLQRAHNNCEFCGRSNHNFYWNGKKWIKIILTIAHLDHDKSNREVSLERLKALCQRCHLQYDLQRHVNNRKYGRKHRENNYKLAL